MRSAEYELRADERSRFEQDLLMPLVAILSIATIVLYATASSVPGQFAGRGIHIPFAGAIAAFIVLVIVWAMNQQRSRKYVIDESGVSINLAMVTYVIPYADITEVVSVADRRPQPILQAVFAGSLKRAVFAFRGLFKRITGGADRIALTAKQDYNFTTSDTGGARIDCKNGSRALMSPMDLSNFLRHLEAEFSERGLDARVVREISVQITRS